MPCIAEYSAPSSSLTLLVIREKVAEGIQSKVYATSASSDLTDIRDESCYNVWRLFCVASTLREERVSSCS